MLNNECVLENKFFDHFRVIDYVSNTNIYINKCNIRVLSVHAINWESKVESKRHKHSFFELHYILEGSVFLDIDGDVTEVGSKHFYLLRPGIMHYEYQNESNSHKGVVLRWEYVDDERGDNAKYSCMELSGIKRILYNSNNKPVADDGSIYQNLIDLLNNIENNENTLVIQLAFIKAVLRLSDFYKNSENIENTAGKSDNLIVNDVIAYINKNYRRKIRVEEIAEFAHMSYSYLSNIFKKSTGRTIIEYIDWVRLCASQYILACTKLGIQEVAREIGYSSHSYFCYAFKKRYGISPGEYRKLKNRLNE